jgi:hypothetical protein
MPRLSRKFSLGQKVSEGCAVFATVTQLILKYTICNGFTEPTVFGFLSRGLGRKIAP